MPVPNPHYPSRWQRCGHVDGALLNCEPEETGTAELLAETVKATESGAVRWECE